MSALQVGITLEAKIGPRGGARIDGARAKTVQHILQVATST